MCYQHQRFRSITTKILALLCACVFLLAPATPTRAFTQAYFHTQSLGNQGTDVKAIQYLLSIYPSGVFDTTTYNAVHNFQQAWGLAQDGIVGPATWNRLIVTLRYGNSGNPVRAVQILLKEKWVPSLLVTGVFDDATYNAVINFEYHAGLSQDGIMDPETWKNLVWHYERIDFSRLAVMCPFDVYNGPEGKWGTAAAVGQMEAVANEMYNRGLGGIAIEALSLEHGGPIVNHGSHQVGLDIDIQVMRTDGQQCPAPRNKESVVTISHPYYDRARTRELIKAIRASGHVKYIFFDDQQLINEGLTVRDANTQHADHLHVRYCEKTHVDSKYVCP